MIGGYIADWHRWFPGLGDALPWDVTSRLEALVADAIPALSPDYRMCDAIAIHTSATVEPGAVVKGPAIIGPGCFVAGSAYLRGGVWLERQAIVGPGAELKTSIMCAGSKLAHLNFVGDSILGADVNIEAGAMLANYRNERADKRIRIRASGALFDTGVDKFGALLGDAVRIGANAVVAPGALLAPGTIVPRLSLVDQAPD